MLSRWGAVVTEAEGGEQGLAELLRAKEAGAPYSLVLLDRRMPGVDGFEVAEPIHQQPTMAGTTILMLTSENRAGDVARGRALGVAAYLVKPVKQAELLEAIQEARGGDDSRSGASPRPRLDAFRQTPQSLRILLAEDSQDNVLLIEAYLKASGYSADVARNGRGRPREVHFRHVRRRAHGCPDADHGRLLGHAQDPAMGNRERRDAGSDPGADRARAAGRSSQEPRRRLHGPPHEAHPQGDAHRRHRRAHDGARPGDLEPRRRWSPAFSRGVGETSQAIAAALERSDYDNVRILGHNMKGSGAGYGFNRITEIGASLEQAAGRRAPEEIRARSAELVRYLDGLHVVYE